MRGGKAMSWSFGRSSVHIFKVTLEMCLVYVWMQMETTECSEMGCGALVTVSLWGHPIILFADFFCKAREFGFPSSLKKTPLLQVGEVSLWRWVWKTKDLVCAELQREK